MWFLFTLVGHEEEHVQHVKNKNFPTPLTLENSYLENQGLEVSILSCNTDLFLLWVLKDTLCSFNEDQGLYLCCFLLYPESST